MTDYAAQFDAAYSLYKDQLETMSVDELIEARIMAGTARPAPLWMHRNRFFNWLFDLEYTRF